MLEDLEKFENDTKNLKAEIEEMKSTVSQQLATEQPNVKEFTDKMVHQALEE